MPTRVRTTEDFDKQVARIARKFPAVLDEVATFISRLKSADITQLPGRRVRRIGYTVYKEDCQIHPHVGENGADSASIIGSRVKITLCLLPFVPRRSKKVLSNLNCAT